MSQYIACVAWFLPLVTAGSIPEEYSTNLTVYHINPLHLGTIPVNMDTADALGDLYFDFRSKVLPLECAPGQKGLDCKNHEVIDDDLVITKLVLEIDDRFGLYGRCNVCQNGKDPLSKRNCTGEDYMCTCFNGSFSHQLPCGAPVGFENITETHGNRDCKSGDPDWKCFQQHTGHKFGGSWYSTHAEGYCGDGSSPPPAGCTWRVLETVKTVNKTCSDDRIYNTIEAHDDQQCFTSCEDSGLGQERNTSSYCWIKCLYTTMLGPDAGSPHGDITGMPVEKIVKAWEQTFTSTEKENGGCPPLVAGYTTIV